MNAVVEQIVGAVEWQDSIHGYCRCPGEHLHRHRSSRRHCRVYLDGVPSIFCVHNSCASIIDQKNRELRQGLQGATVATDPAIQRRAQFRQAEREREAALQRRAFEALPRIVDRWAWPDVDTWESSPVRLDQDAEADWRHLVRLFRPADVIWIGEPADSGAGKSAHFRTAREWFDGKSPGYKFTCPSTFKPGSSSRANDSVLLRRFLVLESDTLSRAEMLAVFNWCRKSMRLRAIVSTGGKSLHGWFEFPSETILAELKIILPAIGFDPSLFRASQPCRLPGIYREEKQEWQSLMWLDLKGGGR